MSTKTRGSHLRRPIVLCPIFGQRTAFLVTVVGAVLALPSVANAQSVGTADPQGGIGLTGPPGTPYKSVAGNPLNFDSTIQFQGLTATGQAENSYVFQSNYQAVTASETLSLSGSLVPGYDNSYASLSTGATLSGMHADPNGPPDGADYLYEFLGAQITIRGVLAPGDTVFVYGNDYVLSGHSDNSPCVDLLTGKHVSYSWHYTLTNNSSSSEQFAEFIPLSSGGYFGDWLDVSETSNYGASIFNGINAMITKTRSSSSAESWVEIDPTIGTYQTTTGAPEPSSLVLGGFGTLCMVAYTACRRRRPAKPALA